MSVPRSALSRFLAKVEYAPDGCWLWTGACHPKGYGKFSAGGRGSVVIAHRWSYEHFVGPIPEGLQLDHLCRVRRCVNPEHLEPVTARENLLRGDTVAARWAARTHCQRGHAYTEENTRIDRDGSRACRKCGVIETREYRARARSR